VVPDAELFGVCGTTTTVWTTVSVLLVFDDTMRVWLGSGESVVVMSVGVAVGELALMVGVVPVELWLAGDAEEEDVELLDTEEEAGVKRSKNKCFREDNEKKGHAQAAHI
jgi:hypothetical protein